MRRLSLIAVTCVCASTMPEHRLAVKVPMRDGVKLTALVYLPNSGGRHATLLMRSPYNKFNYQPPSFQSLLDHDFAVVVQDVRGRYESEGVFRPLTQEIADGDDTLNWIARQPWSNGKVGMFGGSYLGIAQWRAALSHNPHLLAIFPVVSGVDEYKDRFYSRGGAMKLGHRLWWISQNLKLPWPFRPPDFDEYVRHLPVRTADEAASGRTLELWQEALYHPNYDAYWKARSTFERLRDIHIPVFIVGGWYDNFVQSDLDAFSVLGKQSGANRIIIGPWPHNQSAPFPSGITFGPKAGAPIRRYQIEWFDHWMRAVQPAEDFPFPKVRIFVMGIDRWRDEEEWPLARAHMTSWYLESDRGANSIRGDGRLSLERQVRSDNDNYTYDPRNPVPTAGGAVCCDPKVFPWGPMDQRSVESREDVLVYTSAPLRSDVEVTGDIRANLWVSTSAPDTDFTAKLVDVFPDGHTRNLCDGILRLRYREGLEATKLARPGRIYPITIDAGVTSNVFRAGHRIRVEISSSNFPRFSRNLNTGGDLADEKEIRIANQTVFHGPTYPSRIVLPVIP